jgi:hypothetical protein
MLLVTNALYSHLIPLHLEIEEGVAEMVEGCWRMFLVRVASEKIDPTYKYVQHAADRVIFFLDAFSVAWTSLYEVYSMDLIACREIDKWRLLEKLDDWIVRALLTCLII